jgi:hypothetical protein
MVRPMQNAPPKKKTGDERRQEDGVTKKSINKAAVATIPNRFRPRFWTDADQRIAIVRQIRERYELIKRDCGGDESIQRDAMCQRLAFLLCVLSTKEVECLEGEGIDLGSYIQAVNSAVGLTKLLGLSKRIRAVQTLEDYVASKAKPKTAKDKWIEEEEQE